MVLIVFGEIQDMLMIAAVVVIITGVIVIKVAVMVRYSEPNIAEI